jgi:predicted Zn-dependent protease
MEQVHRFADAADDYRRAVELNPTDDWARLSLAEILLHLGRSADAAKQFECLSQRLPDNAAILLGLARCRLELGQLEEACPLLDRLLADQPEEPLILRERGRLALQEGQTEKAEGWLRRAVVRRPSDRRASYALYRCLEARGRTAEAEEYLGRVRQIEADEQRLTQLVQEVLKTPHASEQRCQAGILCLRLGQESEGVRWLLSALQENPGLSAANRALADHYQSKGRPDLAAQHRRLAGSDPAPASSSSDQVPARGGTTHDGP